MGVEVRFCLTSRGGHFQRNPTRESWPLGGHCLDSQSINHAEPMRKSRSRNGATTVLRPRSIMLVGQAQLHPSRTFTLFSRPFWDFSDLVACDYCLRFCLPTSTCFQKTKAVASKPCLSQSRSKMERSAFGFRCTMVQQQLSRKTSAVFSDKTAS